MLGSPSEIVDADDGVGVSSNLLSSSRPMRSLEHRNSQDSGDVEMQTLPDDFTHQDPKSVQPSHPNQLNSRMKKFRESYLDDLEAIPSTVIDARKAAGVYRVKSQKQLDSNFVRYLTLLGIIIGMAYQTFIVTEVYQQSAPIVFDLEDDSPWMPLSSVSKLDDIYTYLETTVFEVYTKDLSQKQEKYMPYGSLLLRQVRVKSSECGLQVTNATCYRSISQKNIDKNPFGPFNNPNKYTWTTGYSPIRSGYDWSVYDVYYGIYGDGAHTVIMAQNSTSFASKLAEIKGDEWLSLSTAAVSVNFGFLNSETSMATSVEILFEIFPTGYIHKTASVNSFPLERFQEASYVALYAIFLIRILLEILYEFHEGLVLRAKNYFSVGWNILNVFSIMFLLFIVYKMKRSAVYIQDCYEDIKSFSGRSEDFDHLVYIDYETAAYEYTLLRGFVGFSCFLVTFKLFKYFRYNENLNFIWNILSTAASQLLTFTLVFLLVLSSFSIYGYFSFGNSMEEFHTWWLSMVTTFLMLSANFEVERFAEVSPFWGYVFVISFIVFICLIFVNVFIAILSSTYEMLSQNDHGSNGNSLRSENSSHRGSGSSFHSRMQGFGVQIHLANGYKGTIYQKDVVRIVSKPPVETNSGKDGKAPDRAIYVAKSHHLSSKSIQEFLLSTDILCFESVVGSENKLYLKRYVDVSLCFQILTPPKSFRILTK
eukprot:TRINITY_DN1791_c0_g3_i2.p1 TRINITY_DN1791_c0_g3~~TRINITY_DN1791_c0_g3_i2.p1  ORF type:complete len:707 (+),score=102.08 TRINITY_DN1791_c0_g3_i2:57-2177(+)